MLKIISGLKAFNSKWPCAPPWLTAKLLPITWQHTILSASIWVGFTFPGIIDEPGSLAGMFISPNPDLGPDERKRKSFRILNNEMAREFKELEKLTNESWFAIASNLFIAGLYLFVVILFRCLQKILSKFLGALIPDPTAVPPWAK